MRTFLLIFSMSFFLVFSSCNEQESTTITDVPVDESKVNDVPPILDKSKVNQSVTCSQEFLEKQLKETHDSLFKGENMNMI